MDERIAAAVEAELLSKHATVWGQAFDVVGQRLDAAVDYYAPFVEAVMRRLLYAPSGFTPPAVSDQPRHEVLGMEPEAYERAIRENRGREGWEGMSVSQEPRWHGHPDLRITHGHSQVEVARTPHTHRLSVSWDYEPLPVPEG